MEKRVKIFVSDSPFDLEDRVNQFLEETEGSYKDIKYNYAFTHDPTSTDIETESSLETYSALLIYTPGEP